LRIWRLLVEIGPEVWTFVAAAPDHTRAWQVVLARLAARDRELAFLEELEATGAVQSVGGSSRVIHAWLSAPLGDGPAGDGSTDAFRTASRVA
jgi:hypothetical protein